MTDFNDDTIWINMMKQNIYEYIKNIDFSNPDFKYKILKENIKSILGHEPGINLKWKTLTKINELKKASNVKDYIEKKDIVEEIDITFVDSKQKIHNIKYIIN